MSKEIEDHRILNRSSNEPFSSILEKHVSRRGIMQGGLGVAAMSVLGGFGLAGCSDSDDDDGAQAGELPEKTALALAFESIAGSMTDAVVVPEGYTAQVLIPWGTPLNSMAPDWSADRSMTPEIQANSVGMHHDGMYHFPLSEADASNDFLLALNNEYIDQSALWAPQGGPTGTGTGESRPADEVRTEINAHGVTIVRVQKQSDGTWAHVPNSPYNRRFTSATPMELAGPVRGSEYVVTAYSTDGTMTRGTNNNCASGYTPWGTYLTCEENWPGYFIRDTDRRIDDRRLGISEGRGRYGWETAAGDASETNAEFARFIADPTGATAAEDYRNEPRAFGYIVEIDPYTNTRAVKRTALGRFRHEGCWPGKLVEGQPVVFYSGHDSRNEYIYKFVSDAVWDPADANRAGGNYDRLAIGAKYMDQGTLYVAKFNADGTGEWLPLTPSTRTPDGQTLASALGLAADDQAGIIIHTCDAADLMGATPMDRPEWGAVDPVSGEVYMTLTNNSRRTEEGTDPTYTNGGSDTDELGVGYATAPVNGPNPRANNEGGQVIRWREPSAGETTFEWEVFVFGAAAGDQDNLSGLTELNQFASPDGLWYDERGDGEGILWIQTDNGYEGVTDYTNDQLLAVVPNSVSMSEGDAAVIDPSEQQQLKRFAVGPNGCEVTGIFATPDKTALFINIQHPGNWPADPGAITQPATNAASGDVRPRASTVVIQKADGGQIGV
ncbi:PhoX family phosphatase [Halomonas sp. McH1-25]|uniref:PhoX family protein n=1 Tax=unclassified Halomonas TaxID=2609666 RepID=UPI001EF6E306|nr:MULTISPECIES: PhoX family phosphatase [unclassified Halomonas]MCG7601609.1 PhoX family phosphatase [Halomonas sp. McH1-25]MCP1343120.1 PhoX family phosphatase [Halomonas sp. FL8]MCP1360931.1 PhoX family phosphatase [Halomonas sp. BBD45]MCP1366093.1 PhoX family phosphatase [Halomonas sp. BBD48]